MPTASNNLAQGRGAHPGCNPIPSPKQTGVLVARYADCLLGDLPSVGLLLAQAPLIGWLCTLVYGEVETDTPTLYFILCLSAVWFGCINACREIVKERAVLERERFFGLSLPAYVASKATVLAAVGVTQVTLLLGAVEWHIHLKGPLFLHWLALVGAALCGVGLGLLVSALAGTQERAVFAVPLLIIPQILFSEFAIPKEHFGGIVGTIEKLMPVRWAYQVFAEAAAAEPGWLKVAASLAVLPVYALALAALAAAALLRRREVV